ncbi:MAG: pullulanase-type alpha-1,6-glucosidase [Pseudomonadota bacterium]
MTPLLPPRRRPALAALGRCRGLVAAGLLVVAAGVQAEPAATLRQACDAGTHASVLQADATRLPASAVWLDATRLQWPGAPLAGHYRLLHAAAGGIRAVPGAAASGAGLALPLLPLQAALPAAVLLRHRHLADGVRLALPPAFAASPAQLQALHRGQLVLVQEDGTGQVLQATQLQAAAALDDLYAPAEALLDLGVQTTPGSVRWRLWAPTAQAVWLCLHASDSAPAAPGVPALQRDHATGSWALRLPQPLPGRYYRYLVDVWVPGTGLVRQRVTDPYAISLGTDGHHAWAGSLDAPETQPPGWAAAPRPAPRRGNAGLVVYELHVRDFSRDDASVPHALRGKYSAFTQAGSQGMQHLRALARAGLTDVHLLPVFDIASVPESGCSSPTVPDAAPDSPAQQAAVVAQAAGDCFNWGYDPLHFNAPEGSYASRADDGAARIRELRQLVMALHRAGLRVGMDVVYNHMAAAGQHPQSVLDRIVPGYYHRLDALGAITRSTCCDNTATEHRMVAKLMLDSVRLWARHYRIDSFRFDLMGHQPRAAMQALQRLLRADNGRDIQLIGEGWNFGEVADGARFVQAAQGQLSGTGIATFSDRARDALRGGGVGDGPAALVARQGWLNGLAEGADPAAAAAAADLLRLGLAGTLRSHRFTTHGGDQRRGDQLLYAGQAAGYADAPGEVVNYVENHDNHTLWDLNAFKLPLDTPADQRARVQVLALATTAFSQGVAYFHAGVDLLRSKSMDGNSYDSGDWFNRIDWSGAHNHFGSGLPPAVDNQALWPLMAARLADARLRPAPADIAFTRAAFRDLLRIRASSSLFRLDTAAAVQQRLRFHHTGPGQNPALVVGELDGRGLAGAGFRRVLYLLNASAAAQSLTLPASRGQPWVLHPVHRAPGAADRLVATQAAFDRANGRFSLPPRSAVVFVVA